jgi:hypothetical protein
MSTKPSSCAVSREFLEKTIQVWQPHYKEPLTLQDAQEIIDNVYNVYSLLDKWDRRDRQAAEKEGGLNK